MDLGFRISRTGKPTLYALLPEHFLSALNNAREGELLIAISRSGDSRQVLHAAELARDKGLGVVAITASESSPLSKLATQRILATSENGLFGKNYSPASHLCEMVINDLLIHVLESWDRIIQWAGDHAKEKEIDSVEYILSEYKL
jgi:DNA-binding MurR/RpiR family transcriptional regulator